MPVRLMLGLLLLLAACAPAPRDDADQRAPAGGAAPTVTLGGSAGTFYGVTGR